VPAVLGSRSTDTLSGLGPPALRDGDVLPVGTPQGPPAPVWFTVPAPAGGAIELRVLPGPRVDWFTAAALTTFTSATYTVSPKSNRVAARLTGPRLTRAIDGELPSEGLVLGAVQVPAGGEPLVFLADHPTTGGYPVIGVVEAADLPALAQARPGQMRSVSWPPFATARAAARHSLRAAGSGVRPAAADRPARSGHIPACPGSERPCRPVAAAALSAALPRP
jgi:allophanate hydrolase subunit 2